MAKLITLLALSLFGFLSYAKDMADELQTEGKIVGVGYCTINEKKYDCLKVELKGETYAVSGVLDGKEFTIHYISKLVDGKFIIVWPEQVKNPRSANMV